MDSNICDASADAVVIGAGTAGLVTAARLLEQGSSVILISSSPCPVGRGGSTFVMGSKLMDEMGVFVDPEKAFKKMMGYHSFLVDQDKWWLHANKSREAMDWLIDLMVDAKPYGGVDLTPVLEDHYEDPEGITSEYWGTHDFIGGPHAPDNTRQNPQQDVVENLAAYCEHLGATILYRTKATRLEKDAEGRVRFVHAQNKSGDELVFEGRKAVVLATGDFGRNKEMVRKYCPQWAHDLEGGVYKGEGHEMALEMGAAWQKTGMSAPMVFNFAYIQICNQVRAFQGLLLNKNGERFSNEDNVVSHAALAGMMQPDHVTYAVWDSAYAQTGPWGHDYLGGPSIAGENGQAMLDKWDSLVASNGKSINMNGTSISVPVVKGNVLRELAERFGLPADGFMKSVERYNAFCETGIDEDFHKREGLLHPVITPPYYVAECRPWFLVATGGLRTDLEMRVLDARDEPLPGLYAVGTLVGDIYANCYSTHFPGHNLGANCLTFGYVAAESIASQ